MECLSKEEKTPAVVGWSRRVLSERASEGETSRMWRREKGRRGLEGLPKPYILATTETRHTEKLSQAKKKNRPSADSAKPQNLGY